MLSLSPPAGDVVRSRRSCPRFPRMTAATRASTLLTTWAYISVAAAAQMLPYIPTSIFLPALKPGQIGDGITGEVAYIFSPQDDSNSADLLAVNISATLVASSLPITTLSSGLPFLKNSSTAFVPSLADNGSLIVYAGDCALPSGFGIWSFDPSASNPSSSLWVQEDTQVAADVNSVKVVPGFLGAGFSFSTTLEPEVSPANTFVYGGMCPNNDSYPTSPQSQATYSNQMVKISPSTAGSKSYTVEPVESSGPPVPEAGFTFTSLSPSFSNRSNTITQQTNYVLLGGHTQYAFINMSTVAIWSLPEESWSFVSDIGMAGPASPSTDSVLERTVESVDSRSGHTAVLNADGTALVIFGGWVGDLTQAAFPQLAVLEIGSDYGGNGEWQWSIPSIQPSGNGIYGHGSALLPGNVMMVYGGRTINPSGSNNKRQSSGSTASFLNLTSMNWSDSYTNPSYSGIPAQGISSDPNSGSQKQKLGLGLGIGLGLGFLILAILAYLLYRRRHRRTVSESTIRALAQDNSRFIGHDDYTIDDNNWYAGGPDPYARGGRSLGYQSLQTGRTSLEGSRHNWFGDLAPPAAPMVQINRKSVAPRAARGQHQVASSATYEPVANPRGMGGMNPIFEADEDDSGDIGDEAMSPVRDGRRDSGAYSDPFLTPTRERPLSFPPPTRTSQTPSPEERMRASVTDPDVQDWMTDVDAADALLSGRVTAPRTAATAGAGRTSPSRRGFNVATEEDSLRTESNISESNRSNLSRSGSLLRQLRPGFGVAVAAALAATTEGRGGSSSSSSAPSYNTARSSFPALQAEGPGLLLGREKEGEDAAEDVPREPGSPSKDKPRRSWFGSLRRVFANPSPESGASGELDEDSPFQGGVVEANDFEARLGSLGGIGGIAADGLLRRKGGRGAWEPNGAGSSQGATRYSALRGLEQDGQHPDDEEWDIEKAVEKRLVQVLFTVPREPLRVVNAEPDFESELDVVVVDPENDEDEDRRSSEEQRWVSSEQHGSAMPSTGKLESPPRPISTPSPLGDESAQRTPGSSVDAETEALRRELDEEWERIEADKPAPDVHRTPEPPKTPTRPLPRPPSRAEPRTPDYSVPRRPPLLHHPHIPRSNPRPLSSALEEQIDKLGAELHATRSAAHTPVSIFSQHSDADVLSAEAIRYERPSGSTSTLQITPIFTGTPSARGGNKKTPRGGDASASASASTAAAAVPQLQNSGDFRSESNLRGGNELRKAGNSGSPVRRVRAMVEVLESKSSREASPTGSPVKASPARGSPAHGTPTKGSPARGR
ncbi:hypothetical protein F4802DRAFT_81180 [Xylaria palmicola]|nr:hypothetical protein F4802DRAFT_81180 [Xylaria palmicola]